MKDFFISYNKADKEWAEWIAWTLEEAKYSVVIQAWDFRPGENFILEMQQAAAETRKTLVVLSDNYLRAEYTQPEWAAAAVRDPRGLEQTLILVRVQECEPTGLLRSFIYVDLVEISEQDARVKLLGAFSERGKPPQEPPYPGVSPGGPPPASQRVIAEPVSYPGRASGGEATAVMIHLTYPGIWIFPDTAVEISFDGRPLERASLRNSFQIDITTEVGPHVLTLRPMVGFRSRERAYQLSFCQAGQYTVRVSYNRVWGNFDDTCEVQFQG